VDLFELRKRDIDRLGSDLEIYNRRKAEEIREPGRFSRMVVIIIFVFALLSFPAVYLPTSNTGISFILPILLLAAGLVVIFLNRSGTGSGRFNADEKLLENEFKKIGFKIKILDEVIPEIAIFEERFKSLYGDRDSIRDQIRLLEMEDSSINDAIKKSMRDRKSLEIELEEIFGNLDIKNIE